MAKRRKLLIVGAGEFAEIACEYFSVDSHYEVVGFAVEAAHLSRDRLCDRPVISLDEAINVFAPSGHDVFVAVTYTQLNRVRRRLLDRAKDHGYRIASFVSPNALVWRTAELGENVFVFEGNVLQHGCRVHDNVILWSGNHIGHRAVIGAHNYIASHAVVSGYCEIGESCFLGVNSTLVDRVKVGDDCFIAAGAVVTKNMPSASVCRGNPARPAKTDVYRFLNISAER